MSRTAIVQGAHLGSLSPSLGQCFPPNFPPQAYAIIPPLVHLLLPPASWTFMSRQCVWPPACFLILTEPLPGINVGLSVWILILSSFVFSLIVPVVLKLWVAKRHALQCSWFVFHGALPTSVVVISVSRVPPFSCFPLFAITVLPIEALVFPPHGWGQVHMSGMSVCVISHYSGPGCSVLMSVFCVHQIHNPICFYEDHHAF